RVEARPGLRTVTVLLPVCARKCGGVLGPCRTAIPRGSGMIVSGASAGAPGREYRAPGRTATLEYDNRDSGVCHGARLSRPHRVGGDPVRGQRNGLLRLVQPAP